MSKFEKYCQKVISETKLTDAMLRAFAKTANVKMICQDCGMTVPKYPGAYPKKCPQCEGVLQKTVMEKVKKRAKKL